MIEGLSTYSALAILNDELKTLSKKNYSERNILCYFLISLKTGIFKYFLIANILALFLVLELFYKFLIDRYVCFWKLALFFNFLFIIIINFTIISRGAKSRYSSINKKLQLLIDDIQHIMDSNCEGWSSIANYPFVKIPFANSVNLQWTIRDNQLINLPVALLVIGDKIHLRPGQFIFADCQIINDNNEKDQHKKNYTIGQTFIPSQETEKCQKVFSEKLNNIVIPMKGCVKAVVMKTPIISHLEDFLVNHFEKKIWMITVPERYLQFSVNALLLFVVIVFAINCILHILWFTFVGYNKDERWLSSLFHIFLIGLPLQLPLLLYYTSANIIWKINCLRCKLDRRATLVSTTVSMESIPSSLSSSSSSSNKSGPVDVTMEPMSVSFSEYIKAHWNQIINQDYQFAQMIYSMGSLTSLCCVDKKGILAEPIATPEKVFMYRRKHRHRSSSLINLDRSLRKTHDILSSIQVNSNFNFEFLTNARLRSLTANSAITSLDLNTNQIEFTISNIKHQSTCSQFKNEQTVPLVDMNCSLAVPVILDMTRSNTHPYLPSFDDNRWERYISSLKPIGLNILLNNCNPDVTDRYINFTDNMSAINFKNLNKSQLMHRCICSLATQIGFKSSATDRFTLDSTFAVCQKSEKPNENNMVYNHNVYSPPVGNVFSTVVKDSIQNNYQLMSQGSADLLMSMCSDYWDGKDISPLTAYDRSRVLDFYNRNIFSSYCIGFAYSPLFNKITLNGLEDQFILQMIDVKEKRIRFDRNAVPINQVLSSSTPFSKVISDISLPKTSANPCSRINNQALMKSEEIKSLLHHQIFLGMISLQADQVQSDVIECINKLEQACIRFVFFSTDNQLRSRVFAERLGMESGWNCHISLAEPDEINKTFNPNLRRSSSKGNKTYIAEETFKENSLSKRNYSSEPILHVSLYEMEQITHSTTLNEKNFFAVPKSEIKESQVNEDSENDNFNSTEYGLSSSTSTTINTANRQSSYIENPHDHFPEDKSKLPCGIKSIRPHLEEIDNVPLQVSLFTDCNPEVDHEMMSIMREYGEIICCCGSGLTVKNVPLFASNDCAVAFVPILHKQCWRQHEVKPSDVTILSKACHQNKKVLIEEEPMIKKKFKILDQRICFPELSPINIACRLVALPCGLLLNRKTGFDLIAFITECHRLVKNTLASVAFYCLSCASFVILKLFFNISILIFDLYHTDENFFLSLDLFPTNLQIIYHFYFHAPVLALVIYSRLTMLGKPLKEPPRKRGRLLTYKQCYRFILASLGRFIPSIIICILMIIWNILILCPIDQKDMSATNRTMNYSSSYVKLIPHVISDFIFVQHNLYIIIISLFYITPEKPIWKFNFLKNYCSLIFASFLVLLQFLYLLISWKLHSDSSTYLLIWSKIKCPTIISCNGILVILFFGFVANYWELKVLSVEHRLARLYFGTKLGMYSPV